LANQRLDELVAASGPTAVAAATAELRRLRKALLAACTMNYSIGSGGDVSAHSLNPHLSPIKPKLLEDSPRMRSDVTECWRLAAIERELIGQVRAAQKRRYA